MRADFWGLKPRNHQQAMAMSLLNNPDIDICILTGPAGSGKERIAKYISNKYKLYHLDSGILYRRLSFNLIKNKINFNNIK